jgi:hypothetical protein
MSIPPQYQEVCSALSITVVGDRTVLMQPRSNHDRERQKYYVSLQLVEGDHPPSYSTMYYGQVLKKQWTHDYRCDERLEPKYDEFT